ncbi:MAG: 4-hydroxy-tetrahydrodipicolinate synthase [Corynebacterium sp.]|nr:4-hydroxy-tetrahydrodipicolinate synthase [Corynebacterium sp.]
MSMSPRNTNGAATFGTVVVAMVTPFDDHGALDLNAACRLASHLVDNGVDSLVLSGTTGEAPTTTLEEKLALIKAVRSELGDKARIIAGVGTNNTAASIECAKGSAAAGADAALVVTPYYSKPSQEGVYRHTMAIADAADLPICLYDIPGRSAIALQPDTIKRLAEHKNIQALKDAKGDISSAIPLIGETGLAWYSGDDPLNLAWLAVGATGVISVIGHAAPRALREMVDSFEAGDIARAREIGAAIHPLTRAQARLGGVSFAKAALQLQGLKLGEPRLPQVPASEEELKALALDMEKAGVL